MGWIKLDDNFFSHRKVVSLSKDATLFYLAGLCYSGANLTDGVIPTGAIRIIAAQANVSAPNKLIKELVAVTLWEEADGGYQIHDYLEHNSSSQQVRAKRDAAKERMQRARSQNVRANNERTSREVREPETETETETEKNIGADAPRPSTPKPKPLPEHGPAQQIVKAFCDAVGIEKPVNYGKAAGQAKLLANAGITPDDIPDAVAWLRKQKWVGDGIDLGLILSQADKWQASKHAPKPIRRNVV